TDALTPAERTSKQGLADLIMGLMGAFGSAAGGMVLGLWGFGVLNALGATTVLLPLAAMWLSRDAIASARPTPVRSPTTPRQPAWGLGRRPPSGAGEISETSRRGRRGARHPSAAARCRTPCAPCRRRGASSSAGRWAADTRRS